MTNSDDRAHVEIRRYCPDRPLPVEAYQPGGGAHLRAQQTLHSQRPSWDGKVDSLDCNSEYLWGVDLFNGGYFWEAHEAWEELWHCAPLDSIVRAFLQGLIQCAASALKMRTGHKRGAQRLAAKGLHKLERVSLATAVCAGIEVEAFCVAVREYCEGSRPCAPLLRLQIEQCST